MEWKNVFAVAAVMLLLVSPMAFAREAESGGGSNSGSGKFSVSSITGTVVQMGSDDDGTADQGSGDIAVSANAAATASTDDDGTADQGRGDVPTVTGAGSDDSASSTSSDGFVKIAIVASPQEAQVGDTVKVAGTVGFDSPATSVIAVEKKFKVEIKMTGMDGSLSGRGSGTILFESSDDGSQNRGRGSDDIVSATVRAVASIFGSTDDSADVKQEDGQADKNLEDESSDDSRGSASVVAAVEAGNSGSASQEVTEYIVLKNGESKDVVAYFKARTPGMKLVKMEVYESTGFDCSAQSDAASDATAPCRENFRKVAEAATKVRVTGSPIPVPPGPPLPVNNTTTVASGVIQMSSGWNMISVPVMAKVQMQRVQEACGSQEFAWRLTSSGYVKERTLVPGYGYWVKAGNDCKLDVSAGSYTSELAQLSSGWNLVGAPGQEVQIASFKGNCDITAGPWHYDNPSTASAANPYSLSSTLTPAKAYWIKVSSGCTLGSTEDQPPVPPS